jgi:prepilin-type processing-associated H-X9-DG protein
MWPKKDAVVTMLCVGLAFASLGAVGESGRRRAKEAVCQANLAQWGKYFQDYIQQNGGRFYTGCTDQGYYWPWQLPQDVQDWKANRTWFCPMATQPMADEQGVVRFLSIYSAWGIYHTPASNTYQKTAYTLNPNGLAGSFGLNGYVLNIPNTSAYQSGVTAINGWRDLSIIRKGSEVAMFVDAMRFDLWPLYIAAPPDSEQMAWSGAGMARCCISRHEGAVNSLFVDGSVRKVGLKELWTLKWHQAFNTAGPWTQAGGVQPSDWPEWMRPFKDY